MHSSQDGFGPLLREWRRRRRLSQLDLAAEAEVSQRHLSCVESELTLETFFPADPASAAALRAMAAG